MMWHKKSFDISNNKSVIRRDDGTYYRFSTGHKIEIATSRSIAGPWTIKGSAIPAGSKINLPGRDVCFSFPPLVST